MKRYLIILLLCFPFLLLAQSPTISDFSPKSAQSGAIITLSGTNFGATISENKVFFGTIEASITAASVTSIEVEVPQGTGAEKISVLNTTSNLQAQTGSNFYPTFNGGARIVSASFLPHRDLIVSNVARTVRLADLDGDGWLDIIAATNPELSVFRNLGNGGTLSSTSFDTQIDLDVGYPGFGGNSNDVGIADLDNDGKPDLYFSLDINQQFAPFQGAIGIYRNTSTPGNISFAQAIFLGSTQRISYVAAGDFDSDGRQELLAGRAATAGGVAAYLFVYKNLSSPNNLLFGSEVDITSVAPAGTWEHLTITDINNDNNLDIASLRNFKTGTSVILNQSTQGVIDANTFATNPNLIIGTSTIALSDFDGDNLLELITHNEGNNTGIALRPNTSTGGVISFADSIPYFSNIFREGETAIADLNGDGKKDIAIAADWSQDWVSIMENNFDGTWDESSFKQPVRLKTNTGYPKTLDVGDLNQDGKPDIVTGNQAAFLSILENDIQFPPIIQTVSAYQAQVGESITISGQHFSTTSSENKVRFGTVLADVISSTSTELVVQVPEGATYDFITLGIGIFSAASPQKFSTQSSVGNTFDASSFATPFSITAAADVTDLVVGDLDNDGKTDLLARDGSNMLLFKNQSTTGSLDAASFQIIPNSNAHFITNATLQDFNGDGFLDLYGTARIHFNVSENGTESIEFQDQFNIQVPSNGILSDLSLDGILDQVSAPTSGTVVSISEGMYTTAPFVSNANLPNSVFRPSFNLAKPAPTGNVALADFDGDGYPDIAASNPNTDNVSFFRNLAPTDFIEASDFEAALNFTVGDNPTQVVSGDIDLDGKTDLVVINQNDNSVSVLHNQSTVGSLSFDIYNYPLSASPRLLRIHDLDGDAKPEIVTMNAWISAVGATFSVLKNNTASMDATSFASEQLYTRTNNAVPSDFEIADLDDDGKADIILTSSNPDELVFYKNLVPTVAIVSIDTQPLSISSCEGTNVSFSVSASGTTNIQYQWQVNEGSGFTDLSDDTILSGAQSANLDLTGIEADMNGFEYRCVISGDHAGAVNSNTATLAVTALAAITSEPSNQNVTEGESVIFSIMASGDSLSYQWQKDEQDISGETSSTLVITSASKQDEGEYRCVVSNSCNGLASAEAALTVCTPAAVSSQSTSSVSLCEGEDQTFSVTGQGDLDFTYEWYKNDSLISGATSSEYVLTELEVSDAGDYKVMISNECGLDSTMFTLEVIMNATVLSDPIDQDIREGEEVVFTVAASGENITFQWQKDEQDISGETSSTLTIASVGKQDEGFYRCVVSNSCNGLASIAAELSVCIPVSIQSQSTNIVLLCEGENHIFSVTDLGDSPISYTWFKDDALVAGETFAELTLNDLEASDIGDYKVVVNNGCGSDSAFFELDVTLNVSISADPTNADVTEGDDVTFVVEAGGDNINYQWQKDEQDIQGETTNSLTITAAGKQDEGFYRCVIANTCNGIASQTAELSVCQPVVVTSQSSDAVTLCEGSTHRFDITTEGDPAISYEWYIGDELIPGENGVSYELAGLIGGDSGTYIVVASNSCGVDSATFQLDVSLSPVITSQPINQTVTEGDLVTFTIVADGENVSFQWQKDEVDISGAVSSEFTINQSSLSDTGGYRCVVTNICGDVVSESVTLTVNEEVILNATLLPKILLYPNPAADAFYIEGIESHTNIMFFDMSGKVVHVLSIPDNQKIDISSLPRGIYWISVRKETERLLDQRILLK